MKQSKAFCAFASPVPMRSKRHGLFTYYLLKGLRGEADGAGGGSINKEITLNELAAYTKRWVSEAAKTQWDRSQEPILIGSEGDRVLIQIP